jgi:hypothetical protein
MHSIHPPILEHGLADGCPRCEVLGAYPHGLDPDNAYELHRRYEAGLEPRSLAEAAALATIRVEHWQEIAAGCERRMLDARDDHDEAAEAKAARGLAGATRMVRGAKAKRLDAIWAMAEGSRTDYSGALALEVVEADGVAS